MVIFLRFFAVSYVSSVFVLRVKLSTVEGRSIVSLSEWSTSWLSRCASVWRTKLQGTWSSAALQLTSTFSQPAPSDCSAVSTKHNRPSGLLCWGPSVWNSPPVELHELRRLSSRVENYFIRAVLVYSAQ